MASENIVHVVEDDQAMRESLVDLLEAAGYRVHAYACAEDLLALGSRLPPGCVVSDVRMPGIDGLALLRRLAPNGPPLVLVTGHGDIGMAVAAMKAGAVDFLEKPFEADALLSAVERALRLGTRAAQADDAEDARRKLDTLTTRERQVMEQLVAGCANKEIAANLGISPRTVEFHRAHLMEKTQAGGLPDLVRLWLSARRASGQGSYVHTPTS
jgi:two-component system response regulator FixJ